jgi:hypothetical protein
MKMDSSTLKFGVICSTSNGVEVDLSNQAAGLLSSAPPLTSMGMCLAKAQLFETLDPISGTETITGSESPILNASISDGDVFGLVYECDLIASASTNLRMRTVAYQGQAFGSWLDNVATAESGKPRGWWTKCECVSDCGTFDVSPSLPPGFKEIKCCTDGGPEEAAFAKQAVDTYGKPTRACLALIWSIDAGSPVWRIPPEACSCILSECTRP